MGTVVADYADCPDGSDQRPRPGRRQARVRCDDADAEDRYRCNRGGASRIRLHPRSMRLPDLQRRQSPACHRQQLFKGTNDQIRTIELNVVTTPSGDDPFAVRRERGQLALELLLGLVVFLEDRWGDSGAGWYGLRVAVALAEDDQRNVAQRHQGWCPATGKIRQLGCPSADVVA